MAKTYIKKPLRVVIPNDAYLSVVLRYVPEAASQTFIDGAPLKSASGYAAVATAGDGILGFAMKAGSNTTAGAVEVPIVPAVPGVEVYANFLAASAADNVLAAADLFVDYPIQYDATGSEAGGPLWYVVDDTDGTPAQTVHMVSFKSDDIIVNQSELQAKAGDTNARCTFALLSGKCQWVLS